jgi:hypothetical protein
MSTELASTMIKAKTKSKVSTSNRDNCSLENQKRLERGSTLRGEAGGDPAARR